MINCTENEAAVIFTVRVVPRASKSGIVGEHDGDLKVRIAAPPVDGAANAELRELLAKAFGVPRGDVDIIAGRTSKIKQVRITGAASERINAILQSKT